jgi:hypothetical protein
MLVQQNSFTLLRILLVLTDRGMMAQSNLRRSWAELSFAGMTFGDRLTEVSADLVVYWRMDPRVTQSTRVWIKTPACDSKHPRVN